MRRKDLVQDIHVDGIQRIVNCDKNNAVRLALRWDERSGETPGGRKEETEGGEREREGEGEGERKERERMEKELRQEEKAKAEYGS